MKVSCQENLLPGGTFKDKVCMAEKLGFDAIEVWGRDLDARMKSILDAVSSSRIKISTICSGYPGDLLGLDRKEREDAMNGIIERLRYASELGAVGLIVVPTFSRPKLPDLYPLYRDVIELERRLLIEELRILDRYAADYGVYILLEPINRYETHFMNRVLDAVKIVSEVYGDNTAVMADFFHMNIEERDISESLLSCIHILKHIHLADSNRLPPGFGHTDFKTPLTLLKKHGYRYYMAYECRIPEPVESNLERSLEYVRKLGE
ncbi:MAG: sugar phosphate isomerase/epimerase family protein [Nitrososphaerota archaeon]|nr:sugar phosphate isomerase/epimerase [Candidatus Bathyarchaeota archaeon]MDW8062138.1 sugar phosphate isomerase/epimerase family protein [Nitrososphaerota archaeon]